jgi:TonB family protein
MTAPEPVFAPDPKYSKEGRRRKIEGTVNLNLVVGTDGMASQIKVAKPLGHGLDEEAVKCVEKWRFKPATFDGKPVAVQVSVQLDFHLIR